MFVKIFQPANLLTIVALIFISSCADPMKLLERGQYDEALYLSVKKLSGKKKKKAKFVNALEQAFARATKEDMRQVEALKKEGREENWVEINAIYLRIKNRQNSIEPLLPLYDEDGAKAEFRFVRVEDLELESKEKAADYFYKEGKRKLAEAEAGNKAAAREANEYFEKIKRYYPRFRDEEKLMERARELGTVHVLFKMENNSHSILPKDFEREIKRMSVRDLEKDWLLVHLNPKSGFKYDFMVVMNLLEIVVTPQILKEREYVDDKTIEEGWEYVLDKNGNVRKDSAGNDIKIPKKVIIKARVFETYQHQAAHVGGRLEYFDNRNQELVYSEPLAVDAIFENYAATFDGDKRALSEDSKKKIGNRPLPFPNPESLVLQAADLLKPIIKDKISRSKILI